MARYIGAKCKLMRREGTDLFLKGRGRSRRISLHLAPIYLAIILSPGAKRDVS